MRITVKIMLFVIFSILALNLLLSAGKTIHCLEDHCGENCPYGMCADASNCSGCVIGECYNDRTGEREPIICTSRAE